MCESNHIEFVTLIDDIIIYMMSFLNMYDKMIFMSSSKNLCVFKSKLQYDDKIIVNRIKNLWYYDRFTNIEIDMLIHKFPKMITKLTLGPYFNYKINEYIPKSITHLTCGISFDQSIKNCIPESVTHLDLGWNFDQNIKDCIPNSVTHLTFSGWFNKTLRIVFLIP